MMVAPRGVEDVVVQLTQLQLTRGLAFTWCVNVANVSSQDPLSLKLINFPCYARNKYDEMHNRCMARVDRTEAVLGLAASVTKVACSIWIGPSAAGMAGTLSDLLQPHVVSRLERHRLEQVFSECTGIIAAKLLSVMEHEFRNIPQNEREAAILAAGTTIEKSGLNRKLLIQADLAPGLVLRYMKPTKNRILKQALLSEAAEEIYERILAESSRYLVEVVTTLPRFEAESLVEVLRRQRIIFETLERILGQMPMNRSSSGFATDYFHVVENKMDRMELFGVTLLEESTRVYPLTISYVNLALLEPGASSGQGTANLRVEQALRGKSRILVIGETGSGKTTLLRWLALRACRSDFGEPLGAWNGSVPFFLPLRTFADGNFPPPEHFLDHIAPIVSSEMPVNWVHEQLRGGRALVLVDGVDELAPGDIRDRARAWLEELIAAFPTARYIVTSRPAAANERWMHMSKFSIAVLQPMDTADVRRFVRRWHEAMRWTASEEAELERIDGEERALLAAIDEDRLLRSLSENPLLCALLCALNRDRHGNLPRKRMAVYQAALVMLLERRDVDRKMKRTIPYSASELTILLQDLAYWLLKNGWSDVAISRAEEQLERSMRTLTQTDIDATALLPLLLERSGLLRSPVEGRVDFVHRTFQEYLAGKAAMDNDDVGELIGHTIDDQWRNVIVMAAGHARRKQAEELLRGILQKAEDSSSNESLRILSVACLQTVQQLEPALREEIRQVAATLIPPRSKEAADAIVYAGPGMLDLLRIRTPSNVGEASSYIRTASLIGGVDALRLIGNIAQSFDGLEDDLARAWSYFSRDAFAQEVLSRAKLGGGLVITDERLMPYVTKLTSLQRLEIADLDIQNLLKLGESPPNITTLLITRCSLLSLRGAEKWRQVAHLELTMSRRLPDLKDIVKMASLETLEITFGMGRIVPRDTLDRLAELPALRSLRFDRMDHIVIDISAFQGRSGVTILVPESATIEGADTLEPGSQVIRTETNV